jgi:uncharacterized membrane protein
MNKRMPLADAGKLNVVGLVTAAAGILILFAVLDFPVPVPVGTILLLITAGLVVFGRWRWTPAVGAVLALFFIFVGGFIAPGLFDRLIDPAELGAFVGTWVQMLGLLTAIPAGIAATVQSYRLGSGPEDVSG